MAAFLKSCAVSVDAFLGLDATWLGLVAGNFSRVQAGGRIARRRLT